MNQFESRFKVVCVGMIFLGIFTWLLGLTDLRVLPVKNAVPVELTPARADSSRQFGLDSSVSIEGDNIVINGLESELRGWVGYTDSIKWRYKDHQWYQFKATLTALSDTRLVLKDNQKTLLNLAWVGPSGSREYVSITRLSGLFSSYNINSLVLLPTDLEKLEVRFIVRDAGRWRLSGANLLPVLTSPLYQWGVPVICVAWLALFFYFVYALFVSKLNIVVILFSVFLGLVVVGVLMSRTVLRDTVTPLLMRFGVESAAERAQLFTSIMDVGHFAAFLVLTIALSPIWLKGRVKFGWFLLFDILLAPITEIMQTHVVGRSAQLFDVLIDLAGVLVGLVVIQAIKRLIVSKKNYSARVRPGS